MKILKILKSFARISFLLCLVASIFVAFHWRGPVHVKDGRFNRSRNAIWLQHGWLGDDSWFVRANRLEKKSHFRSAKSCQKLAELLHRNAIQDVFPHLCPCSPQGHIQAVDDEQTEGFLKIFKDFRVIPWVGGVLDKHAFPDKTQWRKNFVESCLRLLDRHQTLAGIQINVEPCPSTTRGFLLLLEELRVAMPYGKIISVAAYPPPTPFHPHPDVHWEENFFREVASRSDQLAVMMYDTALENDGFYRQLMAKWTREVLTWSGSACEILLGVAVYDDKGVGYHHAEVENLENGLAGIQAALLEFEPLPINYQGVAIYCEWEMDEAEWAYWGKDFLGHSVVSH